MTVFLPRADEPGVAAAVVLSFSIINDQEGVLIKHL
jgi:hypothetical protein